MGVELIYTIHSLPFPSSSFYNHHHVTMSRDKPLILAERMARDQLIAKKQQKLDDVARLQAALLDRKSDDPTRFDVNFDQRWPDSNNKLSYMSRSPGMCMYKQDIDKHIAYWHELITEHFPPSEGVVFTVARSTYILYDPSIPYYHIHIEYGPDRRTSEQYLQDVLDKFNRSVLGMMHNCYSRMWSILFRS